MLNETKKNDLLIFLHDDGEQNEKLYLVTSVMQSGIKTINLLTGSNKTIFYKHIEDYQNIGQYSDRLVISKKI